MPFPNIDPVLFSIGPLAIRWYGLAYMVGLLLGMALAIRILRGSSERHISEKHIDGFFIWAVLGVLVGGRLGSVLLYELPYYLDQPLKIFALWEGGMAFHGGLLGVIAAAYFYSRRQKINPLEFGDVLACVAPIGLFFGRIANFVNGELWGRPTTLPWGTVFPDPAAGGIPRHPSQLYEAFLEGVVLFAVLNLLNRLKTVRMSPGLLTGVFLSGYGVFRYFIEFTREPDAPFFGPLTRGQSYSVPMILIGGVLIVRAFAMKKAPGSYRSK